MAFPWLLGAYGTRESLQSAAVFPELCPSSLYPRVLKGLLG